jgi:hypothetical protein
MNAALSNSRLDRLRNQIAGNVGTRPTYVHFVHVAGATWFSHFFRWDVHFEWVNAPTDARRCIVHTKARGPKGALRQVERCVEAVTPGRRFKAENPSAWEPTRG